MIDLTRCQRLIVFGGTFDPPHVAHVRLPLEVMRAIHADAVAYVPAARQPLKAGHGVSAPEHRLAMLRLALAEAPYAAILTDELERGSDKPSYTVDTLEALRDRLGPTVEMRLLIGADQLRLFHKWRAVERVIELAEPAVMVRPPDTRDTLLDALPNGFDRSAWAARLVEVPPMDVSATQIRERVGAGKPIDDMVCPAVAAYIAKHRLYLAS